MALPSIIEILGIRFMIIQISWLQQALTCSFPLLMGKGRMPTAATCAKTLLGTIRLQQTNNIISYTSCITSIILVAVVEMLSWPEAMMEHMVGRQSQPRGALTERGGTRILPFPDLINGLAVEVSISCWRSLCSWGFERVGRFLSFFFFSVYTAALFEHISLCYSLQCCYYCTFYCVSVVTQTMIFSSEVGTHMWSVLHFERWQLNSVFKCNT